MRRWRAKLQSHLVWQIGRLSHALKSLVNVWFGTRWYDFVLARDKRTYRGVVEDSSRIVVYLIFPQHGLLDSHFRALRHFLQHGYAPVVVCNVPLSEADRQRLLSSANCLIERPNYGYDFGGYRDGMLFLRDRLKYLDRLVLMNDSVWFPVAGSLDWLPAAEVQGLDVVGAVANFFLDPGNADGCSGMPGAWQYDTRHPKFHYCSFAISFGPAVLRDVRFVQFWQQLKLSNNKFDTVHRGEIGLGQWIVGSGHSHGSTLNLSDLDLDLDQLEDMRLREVANNLIIPEDAHLREQKAAALARSVGAPDERRQLIRFILQATVQTGPAYALLDFAWREKGYGFVKKSPLWLDPQGAAVTLRLLAAMGESALHEEALMLLERRGRSAHVTPTPSVSQVT